MGGAVELRVNAGLVGWQRVLGGTRRAYVGLALATHRSYRLMISGVIGVNDITIEQGSIRHQESYSRSKRSGTHCLYQAQGKIYHPGRMCKYRWRKSTVGV